jgi:hypothetical protein
MNLQVIASPEGTILWVSGALRGSTHDLRPARIWGILRHLAAAGLIVLADKGYQGHLAKGHPRPANPRNHQMKRLTRSTVRTRPEATVLGGTDTPAAGSGEDTPTST